MYEVETKEVGECLADLELMKFTTKTWEALVGCVTTVCL